MRDWALWSKYETGSSWRKDGHVSLSGQPSLLHADTVPRTYFVPHMEKQGESQLANLEVHPEVPRERTHAKAKDVCMDCILCTIQT